MRRFVETADGVTAVLFALLLGVLGGMVALAVDVTRFYNSQTELQDAADSGVLAAASQLDHKAGAIARAELAAVTSAQALVVNDQRFATDGQGDEVTIIAEDIQFYETYADLQAGDALDKNDDDSDSLATFAEVTIAPRVVGYSFASLLGVFDATSTARAVATMDVVVCDQPPFMVCNPDDNGVDNTAEFPFDDYKNVGLLAQKGGSGSIWKAGNFGMLSNSLTGQDYFSSFGAIDIAAICFGNTVENQTGQYSAVRKGMRVRHDIFEPPMNAHMQDPNYRAARNPIKGLVKGNGCSWGGGQGWNHPANRFGYTDTVTDGKGPTTCRINGLGPPAGGCPDPYDIDTMGFPRDNCHYGIDPNVPPGRALGSSVGCTTGINPPSPDDHSRYGNSEWDVNTYMRVNHGLRWPMDFPGGHPLRSYVQGTPGERLINGLPSRREVYQWEEGVGPFAGPPELVDNGMENVADIDMTPPDATFCSDPMPSIAATEKDRLEVQIGIVNCEAPVHDCNGDGVFDDELKGHCDSVVFVPGNSFMKVFLTEPMGSFESNDDLYVEIIGPGGPDDALSAVSKFILRLVE